MRKLTLFLILLCTFVCGFAKNRTSVIPPVPNPPKLVNDFSGVIPEEQVADMEKRLVAFNDSTTNVICVVIVDDLGDYSAAQFAYEIGDQWGVRSKDKRNGVVIVVKPRNDTEGEVYISVGYDLEGAIPDAVCKRIIERKMIPELKDGKYAAAVDSALAYILPLAAGEISADRLMEDEGPHFSIGTLLIIFFILVLILCIVLPFFGKNDGAGGNTGGSGGFGRGFYVGPYFGGSHWGGGSTWSGGGFGGFGGFGGSGGFGGGGAGGKF